MKAKVREMKSNTRGVRCRRIRKEVVSCFQDVVGKKKFLVQFEDIQKIYMSASFMSYLCEKEELGQEEYETISGLPKIVQVGLLIIDGDPVCEGDGMFEKGVHLYIFYCLCFVEDISENIAEKQVMEDTYP